MRLLRIQDALEATLRQSGNIENANYPSQREKAEFDYAFEAVCKFIKKKTILSKLSN